MEPIRRIKVVGNAADAPKCPRCGKALIESDKPSAPHCRRCSLIMQMEKAVNDLRNAHEGGQHNDHE